ncbi:MAG: hypothetical protein AB4352_24810 [Hormoscilla sp.]
MQDWFCVSIPICKQGAIAIAFTVTDKGRSRLGTASRGTAIVTFFIFSDNLLMPYTYIFDCDRILTGGRSRQFQPIYNNNGRGTASIISWY